MRQMIRKTAKITAAGVAMLVTVVGVLMPLQALAGSTDCYDYDPGAPNCTIKNQTTTQYFCKQLTNPPYSDPGCCGYKKIYTNYNSSPKCHLNYAWVNQTEGEVGDTETCYEAGTSPPVPAPANTDVSGNCAG